MHKNNLFFLSYVLKSNPREVSMETKNVLDVEKFVLDCNNMLSGKFFDLNRRLEKLLAVMGESDDILDLLADCIDGFDEETEFAKAFYVDKKTGATKVSIPSHDKKRVALGVTLFNNLVSKKINENRFLETFFQDRKLTPMQNFLEKVLKPYRDSVCKILAVDPEITEEDVKKHEAELEPEEEKEEFPHLNELLEEVTKSCNQILALLKFEKKRTDNLDDAEFVVGAILKACDNKDLMILHGLVVGLSYTAQKFKNVRHLVEGLNDLILSYYDFLGTQVQETPAPVEEEIEEDAEE